MDAKLFTERFNQRMQEKGLTSEDLLGVRTIGPVKAKRLVSGELVPSGWLCHRLGEFLDCNPAWLEGKTDDPTPPPPPPPPPRRDTSENLWAELWDWMTNPVKFGKDIDDFDVVTGPEYPDWIRAFKVMGSSALFDLTQRDVQTICHLILRKANRGKRDFRALIVRGPKVVDFKEARRRLMVG